MTPATHATHTNYDVIVLGAGIAGLAAARALAEAGKTVLVLEGQAQVGGRMRTLHVAGVEHAIELGAEFIHGRPPGLLALLEEAGLATYETAGEQLCFHDGSVQGCSEDSQEDGQENNGDSLLEGMRQAAEQSGDMSFDAYLARFHAPGEAKAHARSRARNYVEGFNAADASEIGIEGLARQQAAEDAIEGHRAARVVRGYAALAGYVRDRAEAAGTHLLLDTRVTRIAWRTGTCTVHAGGGRQWSARQVVCSLPLGVLQGAAVTFDPEPGPALRAAHSLRPGAVQRLVLQFEQPWWVEAQPRMRFLFASPLLPPTWWTTAPRPSPLLTGWVGGPDALRKTGKPLLAEALRTLDRMFGASRGPLVAAHTHDWQADPFSRGAYSYAPAGAADAYRTLAEPVEHTLFFAGEHTDITGHPGTVHGALGSGLRAARQALTSL